MQSFKYAILSISTLYVKLCVSACTCSFALQGAGALRVLRAHILCEINRMKKLTIRRRDVNGTHDCTTDRQAAGSFIILVN